MNFSFDLKILQGKKYKWVFQHLCKISNVIYFTYNDSLMINERLFELCEQCEQVEISKKLRNQLSENIIGFKIDIFVKLFLYAHEDTSQLLGDRGYGRILFYLNQSEIAYIEMNDFKDVYIETNDKRLIEKLSEIIY